jgi:DNA-binding SARP family transcriptional activator
VETGVESVGGRGTPLHPKEVSGESHAVAVRLFGPFRVARNGEEVGLPASRKVRALIAYLVMAPRPVHRAKLCELLWDVPDDPRGELRWCLSKIRSALDGPSRKRVKTEADWVAIDASTLEVDALWVTRRVEAAASGGDLDLLKQLAGKFEGEFLEGFEADRVPLFEAWLLGERQRFQRMHAGVLSRITALLPSTDEALPYLRKRLELLPYDEAVHRDLLAALAASGCYAEGEAHVEGATRLFRSQGLSSAPLDKAWREHRQVASAPRGSLVARAAAVGDEAEPVARNEPTVHTAGDRAIAPHLSIVILPFANLGGDPEQEYFVDGVTESLTTDLSRMPGMLVIGATPPSHSKARRSISSRSAAS